MSLLALLFCLVLVIHFMGSAYSKERPIPCAIAKIDINDNHDQIDMKLDSPDLSSEIQWNYKPKQKHVSQDDINIDYQSSCVPYIDYLPEDHYLKKMNKVCKIKS